MGLIPIEDSDYIFIPSLYLFIYHYKVCCGIADPSSMQDVCLCFVH